MGGRERFGAGDGIRGLAALAVVLWHAVAFTLLLENRSSSVARPGAEDVPRVAVELAVLLGNAVWVFFALSGYLLARPFARAYLDSRPPPDLRRYARHRVLRIGPAFWAAALLTAVLAGVGNDGARQLLAVPLFLQQWDPGALASEIPQAWTLGVEAAFYVLLPLVAVVLARAGCPRTKGGRRSVLLALLALGATASAATIAAVADGRLQGIFGSPPWLLGTFGVGFAPGIALAILEPVLRPRVRPDVVPALWALAGAGALLSALNPPERPLRERLALTLMGGALVAAPLVREWAGGRALLTGRAATWLGERSYSVYVIHLLVLFALIDRLDAAGLARGPRVVLALALGVPLALLAAAVLHAAVERPALRRRDRATTTRADAAAQPAASSSASTR